MASSAEGSVLLAVAGAEAGCEKSHFPVTKMQTIKRLIIVAKGGTFVWLCAERIGYSVFRDCPHAAAGLGSDSAQRLAIAETLAGKMWA